MQRFDRKEPRGNTAHVSDLIPTNCLRRQYYYRKFPEMSPYTNESVHHFIRGEASEYIITKLADMGVSQADVEFHGITAHPDIMGGVPDLQDCKEVIVELKDTVYGDRLDFDDDTFKSYMYQLLYYLVMTGLSLGILSIRYNVKEMKWVYRDRDGNDWFKRSRDARDVGIESWEINLGKDDPVRKFLEDQMVLRRDMFVYALETDEISSLPRYHGSVRKKKCSWCPFYDKCFNEDDETDEAISKADHFMMLEQAGFVKIEESSSSREN